MEYEITCFGNGEILTGLFNAIAMCLNAQSGSLYQPLIRLSLIIGVLWAALYAIYGDYIKAITSWIIPMTVIMQLLFVPQATVWIVDPISRYHERVDHVPYGLAMVSSYISRIGYGITQQIEKVFVLPDDLKYQKTGTLFGSTLIQQAKTFHITHEDLADNMRQFVGQCVAYDALLGRKYTLADLRHSENIWALVSGQASPVRSFLWREPRQRGQPGARPEIITCRAGVQRFNQQWQPEFQRAWTLFGKKIFGSHTLINPGRELQRYLPLTYQYLTNMAQSAEEILKQNMMIYAVVDGIEQKSTALGNAPNFAVRRAYLQQRSTYETLGSLAAESLPTMKAVLEAIVYATFLFVIPLSILPFGWKFLSSWLQILLWLQMWAPLYAVLNYIMNMATRSKSITTLSISNEAGITIASSAGLVNVNADMAAMAGYLAMSIPFLCIALVKGVGTFVHLASHLSNITQGAASQAATDATSGNYSFGNVTQGNRQISNVSMLNHSYGASFRSGSFQQADGRSDVTTTADGQQVLNVASSNIPISINAAATKTEQLSEQASKHYQKALTQSEASSKSLASSYRNLVDLGNHLSTSQHLSEQMSSSKNIEQIKSIQRGTQMLKTIAKENNLSEQQTAEIAAEIGVGANLGFVKASSSSRFSGSATDQENYNKAENLMKSEDFQQTMREAVQASQSLSHSTTDETSKRLSESVSGSYEESDHFRKEAMKSYKESEDYQKQAAYTRAFAAIINANHTQQFVDWLANQRADNIGGRIGKQGAGHIMTNEPELGMAYAERFMQEKGLSPKVPTEITQEQGGNRIKAAYESDNSAQTYSITDKSLERVRQQAKSENLHWDRAKVEALRQEVTAKRSEGVEEIAKSQSGLAKHYDQSAKKFDERKDKLVIGQAIAAEAQHVTQVSKNHSSSKTELAQSEANLKKKENGQQEKMATTKEKSLENIQGEPQTKS